MEVSTKVPPLADSCKAIRKGLMGIEDRMVLSDSLDAAWTEAVAACAALPKVGGISCWPKLQGPLPVAYQPEMYQAQVNDVNGGRRDDERIGIDPSPAAALRALAERLRAG